MDPFSLEEAFNCISKFAGAFVFWFASRTRSHGAHRISDTYDGSSAISSKSSTLEHPSSSTHDLSSFLFKSGFRGKFTIPIIFSKISEFAANRLSKEVNQLQSIPMLSLAAAFVQPFDKVSQSVLAVPVETGFIDSQGCMKQRGVEVENNGYSNCCFQNLSWSRNMVEPRTGIEFPAYMDSVNAGEYNSNFSSEVLVGTGSRTMTIVKIKSLKVYAFGFYVHPYDICKTLGPKYASTPPYELDKRREFYQDLLREDINMTVKLVVSCNGIKISTVRDAFEKSLRARLTKTNPGTDYGCLQTFGSMFSQDIQLRAGTTINFRRTCDGHLITEIGGNQIGSVHSRDLCRAFFDMYIGDVPVSEHSKEEIGRNVANIIRRC